jgi:hypothetical protein
MRRARPIGDQEPPAFGLQFQRHPFSGFGPILQPPWLRPAGRGSWRAGYRHAAAEEPSQYIVDRYIRAGYI